MRPQRLPDDARPSPRADTSFPFGIWFANPHTLYVADEGDGDNTFSTATGTVHRRRRADHRRPAEVGVRLRDRRAGSARTRCRPGSSLGQPYTVPGYPIGDNAATGLPWAPATDGLRNITGRVNRDGTVTIWAVTSTVSGSGDQGADPNQLVSITDDPSATGPRQRALPAGDRPALRPGPTRGRARARRRAAAAAGSEIQASAPPPGRSPAPASPPWACAIVRDDRQAEPDAASATGGIAAAEAIERVREESLAEARAAVGHVDFDGAAVARARRAWSAPRRSEGCCRSGWRPPARCGPGRRGPRSRRGTARTSTSSGRPARSNTGANRAPSSTSSSSTVRCVGVDRQRPVLGPCQQQEVLRELDDPVGLLDRRPHGLAQRALAAALAQRHLQLGLEHRERHPQLVAGVGDEHALVVEPVLEPVEHLVERVAEPRGSRPGSRAAAGACRSRRSRSWRRAARIRSTGRSARRGQDVCGQRGEQ